MKNIVPILSVRKVSLHVAGHIVSIPDFDLFSSKRIIIKGSSGIGKTTFLKSLLGFYPVVSGDIYFNGAVLDGEQIRYFRSRVFWMPQELSFSGKVMLFIEDIFRYQHNKTRTLDKKELHRLLTLFDLSGDILLQDFQDISVGEKQRIIFCVMLLLNKKLNLMDEPFTGLDEDLKIRLADYLFHKTEMTVLAVSHDPLIQKYADHIITI